MVKLVAHELKVLDPSTKILYGIRLSIYLRI